jgi:hypothetical protein
MTLRSVRLRGGVWFLLLWAVSTISLGVRQVVQIPRLDDSTFADIFLPFIVLPALIQAARGSVGAMYFAILFFALDILNSASPFNLGGVLFHVVLLVVAIQTLPVLRAIPSSPATVPPAVQPIAIGAGLIDQLGSPTVGPARLATSSPPITEASPVPAAPPMGKRINLVALVVALLMGVLPPTLMAYHIRDHGNIPLPSLTVALVGIGTLWTVAAIGVASYGRRHPLLTWVGPVAVFVLGFVLLIAVCPGCTWESR